MEMTLDQLKKCVPLCKNPESLLPHLNHYTTSAGIITPLRQAHFLSQVAHESGSLNTVSENLNYSAEALQKVFKKYFPDSAIAWKYARQPQAIANRVYANRMGNGSEASGDGWKYRGAGLIQLTGKNNHEAFAKAVGKPLEAVGDYLRTPEGAVHSACWFWATNGLNKLADADDVRAVTKRINGGYIGLEDRINKLKICKSVLAQ